MVKSSAISIKTPNLLRRLKIKFRKKPIIVEAKQLFFNHLPWPLGDYCDIKGQLAIKALEGNYIVSDGDWIITGIKGERYPIKDDIFKEAYELVTDATCESLDAQQQAAARIEELKKQKNKGNQR